MGKVSKIPTRKMQTSETVDTRSPEDRFIDEYMIDRDPVAAAIRAGVAKINVKQRVTSWMANPEIRRAIQERTDNADLDTIISPQRIMAGWIEIAFDQNAQPAARNAALKELALIKKMYPQKGDDDEKKRRQNVMFVPTAPSLDNWEKAAMEQQQKLKEDVRS